MTRLLSAGHFTFDVHPRGQYLPTVDKVCHSAAEYRQESDRLLRQQLKRQGN